MSTGEMEEEVLKILGIHESGLKSIEVEEKIGIETSADVSRLYKKVLPSLRRKGKIGNEKIGRIMINYLPRNEDKMRRNWDIKQKTEKPELQLDFTELIDEWQNQLPILSLPVGICQLDGNGILTKSSYNWHPVKWHSLYSDFKEYVTCLLKDHSGFCKDPFTEQVSFNNKAKLFLEKRKAIMEKITEIFVKETGRDIDMRLIEGILSRLNDGINDKCGDFNKDWSDDFLRFNSFVKDTSMLYKYYLENFSGYRDRSENVPSTSPVEYIPIGSTVKKDPNIKVFQKEMDKKIESMLRGIGESESVKKRIVELNDIVFELYTILNELFDSLEKIKKIKNT